jgi:hypothetical protein
MSRKTTPKAPPLPKPTNVYFVAREMVSVNKSYTEPDRVFASKAAAKEYAGQLNRELRALANPFADDAEADWLISRGEKALLALVKKLKLPDPKKAGSSYIEWEQWWDGHYFDMTDAQRDAIWDALDKFNWYAVQTTQME